MKTYKDLSQTEKKFAEYIEWYISHHPNMHLASAIEVLGVLINKYKGVQNGN